MLLLLLLLLEEEFAEQTIAERGVLKEGRQRLAGGVQLPLSDELGELALGVSATGGIRAGHP